MSRLLCLLGLHHWTHSHVTQQYSVQRCDRGYWCTETWRLR